VRSVFEVPLDAVGVSVTAPAPAPGPDLAESYLTALDEAAACGPVIAGGISFGAHLAAEWALGHPDRCAGLLLALPAWHGTPGNSPAATAARISASAVRVHGVDTALHMISESVQPWLAAELSRTWQGYGDGLADSLLAAANRPAPTLDRLAQLTAPTGVAALVDDPVHPAEVAQCWASALPNSALCTTRLAVLAADVEALGRAAVLAWLRAGGQAP
jgi:pimeloyl-ACP methyl ester carboxylesterase